MTSRYALTVLAFVIAPDVSTAQTADTIRVLVHNHEMVLYRTGTGALTIVLEAGGGSSHRVFNALVPGLTQHTRVVTYDRPGFGLSAVCDSPRTALRIAHELNDALTKAGITGPYYLAGWSLGGAIVRTYAGEFPGVTTGILLIDPAPEDFYARAARELPDLWTLEQENHFLSLYADSSRRTEQRELAAYASSMAQARASDEKHSKPTSVLIAGRDKGGKPDPIDLLWIEELRRWAARRPATAVALIPGAGHHISRDKPEAVVEAFLALKKRTQAQ